MMMGKQMPPSDAVNYWGILSSMPGRYIYEGYGIRRECGPFLGSRIF